MSNIAGAGRNVVANTPLRLRTGSVRRNVVGATSTAVPDDGAPSDPDDRHATNNGDTPTTPAAAPNSPRRD